MASFCSSLLLPSLQVAPWSQHTNLDFLSVLCRAKYTESLWNSICHRVLVRHVDCGLQCDCIQHAQVATGAGMVPSMPAVVPPALPAYVPVFMDGRLIGHIQSGALLP